MSALVSSALLNNEEADDDEIYYQTCINLIVLSKLQVDDLLDTERHLNCFAHGSRGYL